MSFMDRVKSSLKFGTVVVFFGVLVGELSNPMLWRAVAFAIVLMFSVESIFHSKDRE